jgi:hypothetical protein
MVQYRSWQNQRTEIGLQAVGMVASRTREEAVRMVAGRNRDQAVKMVAILQLSGINIFCTYCILCTTVAIHPYDEKLSGLSPDHSKTIRITQNSPNCFWDSI